MSLPIDPEKLAEDCILGPDDEPPPRRKKKLHVVVDNTESRAGVLFAPIFLSWAVDARLYSAPARLFNVLSYRSRKGTKAVRLTRKIAIEAGISLRHRTDYVRQLEQLGMVRIERTEDSSLAVTILQPTLGG
jgi:hypothetical protein